MNVMDCVAFTIHSSTIRHDESFSTVLFSDIYKPCLCLKKTDNRSELPNLGLCVLDTYVSRWTREEGQPV